MVPAGASLDYFVYERMFAEFFMLRVLCSMIILVVSIGYVHGKRYSTVRNLTFSWLLCIQAMICYMVLLTDGMLSPYYAGLNLSILAVGIVLPSSLFEAVIFCIVTIILYVAACLSAAWQVGDFGILYNNLFFLITTASITMISAYFNEKRRLDEFRLNYELDQRNKDLAQLDRQKTEFFANVSHELRTPLTLILAPVQDLLERGGAVPDAIAMRLAVVRDNGLRLLKLVNDLLDVIRMEEGKDNMRHIPVDIKAILKVTADGMAHIADTKEIEMTTNLPPGQQIIRGDERAVEKIFVNLINNAIKFTEKGGRIVVGSRRDGDWISVYVKDSGIGIPLEEQDNIFARFHQVDGSSTRRFRGTGLGLALVKEMTERMGGRVLVESTPGQGTTMIVRFPATDEHAVTLINSASEDDDRLERLHRLADRRGGLAVEDPGLAWELGVPDVDEGRATVLVVEDEPDMRRYLVGMLEEEYRVLQGHTGSEGLRVARERSPDLVLLDLMLPEMDGLEVCRRIREHDPDRRQKIMLLTARVDEEAKLTALDHGADDFLTKPFSSVEVKTRLRNLLASAILERDLADRNRRLQKTLAELEATQAQLIQSEKLNALGSLAAGLLHEINNPLNYSLTALQLIRGDPEIADNELASEMLADIDEGMQRIRAIVSDLRAFAYPTEAEKRLPFDLAEALESALRFTSHELKGIEVERALPQSARVLGSRSHITQVLINLLSNAAKAIAPVAGSRAGRIRVTATAHGERLHVRVSDNGVGMDGEVLNRIFEPFFTTRDVGEGMGLGLSISHTIVANHGGRLLVQSRLGEGTELGFDLPIAAGAPG
jgi:signal transduction histidine kinase